MKSLLIASLIALTSLNAFSACELTLKQKSPTAKNAKLDGVSFSAKQIEALKTICNVKTEMMSIEEQVTDFKKGLEKRIERAEKKASKAE